MLLTSNVKLFEKLLLLRPEPSNVAMSSGGSLKFMGMIFDLAGNIQSPEKVLNYLKRSRILEEGRNFLDCVLKNT